MKAVSLMTTKLRAGLFIPLFETGERHSSVFYAINLFILVPTLKIVVVRVHNFKNAVNLDNDFLR